jgi:hypothetical protein
MRNMKEHFCCLLACAAVLLCGAPAPARAATVVFDSGPPNHASANNLGFAWQADDFGLAAGTSISNISFWSVEAAGAYRGSISWAIVSGLGASGGVTLASGTQSMVSRTSLGSVLGLDEYRNDFSLNAPVALGAGTYWLVLHNGSFSNLGDPNEFLWETAAANGTAGGLESFDSGATWSPNGNQHAFQVSAVPEPASVAMLMAGSLLMACLRRRQQRPEPFARQPGEPA